jgi:hypothetical protein
MYRIFLCDHFENFQWEVFLCCGTRYIEYYYFIRKEKEMMKTLETPEEKRARRLAKKEAKERRRKEKMGWDKDYLVNQHLFYAVVVEASKDPIPSCDTTFGIQSVVDLLT